MAIVAGSELWRTADDGWRHVTDLPLHQEQPACHGELRPSMSHESLLARGLDPVEQGGSHLLNNVLRNYN
jgi:hypothetical protein